MLKIKYSFSVISVQIFKFSSKNNGSITFFNTVLLYLLKVYPSLNLGTVFLCSVLRFYTGRNIKFSRNIRAV